ncbi:MAG: hypothetical protein E6G40_11610, partial [Actinobacteria bacterium]
MSAWGAAVFLFVVPFVVTPVPAPAPAQATGVLLRVVPGTNGLVAFDSQRSGNQDIWVVSPDGTGQTQLTT